MNSKGVPGDDESDNREQLRSLRVQFVLPKGAYATTVLANAFDVIDGALDGKPDTKPAPLARRRPRSRRQVRGRMIERVKSAMVGLGAGWVLILMLVLSVVSLAIMLERAWLYWSLRDDVPTLMRDLGRLLRGGDLDGARKRLEASPSAEAAVVIAGIVEAGMGSEAAEEAMLGASALQKLKLEKRLTFLGTLGNNAPFIGLLGTVIGIVGAFDELGKAEERDA